MLPILLVLGCGGASPDAAAVTYGDATVAATLDALVAAEARRAAAEAEATAAVSPERVQALEERISQVELRIAQLDTQGIIPAAQVGYDPRKTTLQALEVQAAMDELYARVKQAEERLEPGLGQPGPGMFTPVQQGPPPGGNGPAGGGMGPPGGKGQPGGKGPPGGR